MSTKRSTNKGRKIRPLCPEYEAKHYYGDTEVDNYYITKGIEQANAIGHNGWLSLPVEYLINKYKK